MISKLNLLLLNPFFRIAFIIIYLISFRNIYLNASHCEGSWLARHMFIDDTITYDFSTMPSYFYEEELYIKLQKRYQLLYDFKIQAIEKDKLLFIPKKPLDWLVNDIQTDYVKTLVTFYRKNSTEFEQITYNTEFNLAFLHKVQGLSPKEPEFYMNQSIQIILDDLSVLHRRTNNPLFYYLICDLVCKNAMINLKIQENFQQVNDTYVQNLFHEFQSKFGR